MITQWRGISEKGDYPSFEYLQPACFRGYTTAISWGREKHLLRDPQKTCNIYLSHSYSN